MKRTFAPPEHVEQVATAPARARVLPAASASTATVPEFDGTARIRRASPGRSVALYEPVTVPWLDPDQRSVTVAEPVKPTCDQFTLTVAYPLVAVLKSATTYEPLASRLANTCLVPLLTIRLAATPSWSTAISRSLVSIALSVLSRWVRSVPSSSGDAAIAQRENWLRRWSAVSPIWSPLPISSESRSFQPPGPAHGCQEAAVPNRALTCD